MNEEKKDNYNFKMRAGTREGNQAISVANVKAHRKEKIDQRLEYLRQEWRAERISYAELAELQSLTEYIDPNDTELLEAAGVPEK